MEHACSPPSLHHRRRTSDLLPRGREIFGPAGARAFTRDLPEARVELYPGGQFLLESALDEVTTSVRSFLAGALA